MRSTGSRPGVDSCGDSDGDGGGDGNVDADAVAIANIVMQIVTPIGGRCCAQRVVPPSVGWSPCMCPSTHSKAVLASCLECEDARGPAVVALDLFRRRGR